MDNIKKIYNIIDEVKNASFDDVEVIVNTSKEISIDLFNGEVEKNFIGSNSSYTVKGIKDGKKAIFNFENEDIDPKFIASKLLDNVKYITSDEVSAIFEGSKEYASLEKIDGGFKNKTNEEKIELLKEVYKIAKNYDERLVNFPHCEYMEVSNERKVVNSKGLNLSREIEYGGIVLSCVASENDETQDGMDVALKLKYDELDAKKIAEKASTKALGMLGAKPIKSGSYDVIIENDAMRSLLSGFSSMFSGEAAIRKLTSLTGKENEKIMDEKITIVDNPLKENEINSEVFDDDGVATYKKYVVEKGVFKTFLHNLKTAKHFNTTSTGNAVGNGVGGINFYIEKGDVSKEEMISNMKEGLLITDLAGLHASLNPVSGDFSAQASGYYISEGKIVKPVTLIVISSNFLTMMNNVEKVGNDLELSYSGYGAPSMLFKNIAISGE